MNVTKSSPASIGKKIIKKLGLDEEHFYKALEEITKLNPRPGASLGEAIGRNLQQIVPDFIVDTYDDGTINISLNNRNLPELRMSRDFTEMVEEHTKNKANQSKESKEAMMFLKQKMDAAQGFIDAVKQRQNTLMTTMQAIIDLQRPFFLEGDESLLRPMILKDVAERTGLDISTISRVSNSKYVQTNYGIYPLKFFFSDGYTTEDGEEMSLLVYIFFQIIQICHAVFFRNLHDLHSISMTIRMYRCQCIRQDRCGYEGFLTLSLLAHCHTSLAPRHRHTHRHWTRPFRSDHRSLSDTRKWTVRFPD